MKEKLVSAYAWIKNTIKRVWHKHWLKITIATLIAILLFVFFWKDMVISIYSGELGLRWSRFSGTKLDKIYDEGIHVIWPWDKMYIYSTRLQTQNDTMNILTAEGLTVRVEFSYRFYALKDSIPTIHKKLGPTYADTFVKNEVEAASMAIIGNFTPQQLYQMSTLMIQSTIKYYLGKQLLEENVVMDDYLLRKLSLPELVSSAIERKMVAQQLVEEFNYKLITEEKEKRRKIIEAEGIRQFEETSKIPILKWKGLEVTSEFAKSNNAKIIIMGNGKNDLPLLLNTDEKK
ncbi:MAG: prohibitin family protein [Ignavibacteriales bacterium]|nr:prohibitin family protein [Ignavibacteriales bacterium]